MSELTHSEVGLAKGIALMTITKVLVMDLLGMEWAWPVTWIAFAFMVPWFLEVLGEDEKGGS